MTVGERISMLREAAGMTQEQLAGLIGTTPQNIYKYEKSIITNIPIKRMEAIAQALNIAPGILAGWEAAAPAASDELRPCRVPLEIDRIYDSLNSDGRGHLLQYGRYLSTLAEYRAEDGGDRIEYIRHYLTAAAAGYAAPIEGEDFELIPRPEGMPAAADFCVDISGDSMEPYIRDGQTVYVQRGAPLSPMDVGIFYVDGDVFCKQYCPGPGGQLFLLSANPKREDANIVLKPDAVRNVVCFGKVIIKKLPSPVYK